MKSLKPYMKIAFLLVAGIFGYTRLLASPPQFASEPSLTIQNTDNAIEPCGPVPTPQQKAWQEMETYAFIHYGLNTYTNQEWGYGNEDPQLFNPGNLDAEQWARICHDAGLKGIILTAKHHSGFCLWPSEFTDYSVKNSPWKNGNGDVVRELKEACDKYGLKFAVYLSPWDRNYPDYGKPEYIDYFRSQLNELLTNYGDMFEVWFDGANGGSGWYGGADEIRKIDKTTYYDWPATYDMIRELQPEIVIWNDGGQRGDLRWVGTEAGYVGQPNWSLLKTGGDVTREQLHHGVENGDRWVGAEVNTSIRPGWFYHESEDTEVKSLAQLMDSYYKSVGRNATFLLNFPVRPDGRIDSRDSITAAAFGKYIKDLYSQNLATEATVEKDKNAWTLTFTEPQKFNRILLQEPIELGQRVKGFTLEAYSGEEWKEISDEYLGPEDSLTTIGYKRIICFPEITADKIRLTVTDSKCDPLISNIAVYLAPEIVEPLPPSPNKREYISTALWRISAPAGISEIEWRKAIDRNNKSVYIMPEGSNLLIDLREIKEFEGFSYLPDSSGASGIITYYELWISTDGEQWEKINEGEFSNIINNPIRQRVMTPGAIGRYLKFIPTRVSEGNGAGIADFKLF